MTDKIIDRIILVVFMVVMLLYVPDIWLKVNDLHNSREEFICREK